MMGVGTWILVDSQLHGVVSSELLILALGLIGGSGFLNMLERARGAGTSTESSRSQHRASRGRQYKPSHRQSPDESEDTE